MAALSKDGLLLAGVGPKLVTSVYKDDALLAAHLNYDDLIWLQLGAAADGGTTRWARIRNRVAAF